jgi:hypothetical protein
MNGNTFFERNRAHMVHHNTLRLSFKSQQNTIFDDIRFKEYEHLTLDKVTSDKEKFRLELTKAQSLLEQLRDDYDKYTSKTKVRETELRSHIQNLSSKARIRDIHQIKNSMGDLHQQILKNISEIDNKTREQIIVQKKDIESRIGLRLMDSEYRYKTVLNDKIKEQDSVMKTLFEYTREMDRIRENYDKIKKKSIIFNNDNRELKEKIKSLEIKNSKMKIDLMNLKKFNNTLKNKISYNRMKKNSRSQSILNIQAKDLENGKTSPMREQMGSKSFVDILENVKEKDNNTMLISLQNISNILGNKTFLKENPRSSSAISSLGNILENSLLRLEKLQKEKTDHSSNNEILSRIYESIKGLKVNSITNNLQLIASRSKLKEFFGNVQVYMNKEQRAIFIEQLMNDFKIKEIMMNDKYPKVTVYERKIKSAI